MKNKSADIPQYSLQKFRPVHRKQNIPSNFGYNQLEAWKIIEGFELYSSDGLISSMGPLKSEFYRISITVSGTLDMTIGLEQYQHLPHTIAFTFPGQIFSKSNISKDAFGYYILFNVDFMNDIVPSVNISDEFPFYGISGIPVFQLTSDELNHIVSLILNMDQELKQGKTGRSKAIRMYLYLVLLEAKRSYERQQLQSATNKPDHYTLVTRFRKLVSLHYFTKRQVGDYAAMLGVSPNHLNRVIKGATARTASETIKEMLLQEAKSLLRYSNHSIAEIAYQLNFCDPPSFNRFFKTLSKETPLTYRSRHH